MAARKEAACGVSSPLPLRSASGQYGIPATIRLAACW
jgi:hypothetical protein